MNWVQGKVCLVTGATSGIGKMTARALAQKGARVVVVSRNRERCANTVTEIRARTGNDRVDYLAADLSSLEHVRRLVANFKERYDRLHVLVNNAGGFFMQRRESSEGIELTWALDHLNYFLLTNLLLDRLAASTPSRVINVSSGAHMGGRIHWDDVELKRGYNGWKAYAQAKLANVMFSYALARRLEGRGVTVNAVHPGFVATNFGKDNGILARLVMPVVHLFARSPEKGAETSIYLASSPEVEGVTGKYFVDKEAVRSAPVSYDRESQERLWKLSARMTGIAAETPGEASNRDM